MISIIPILDWQESEVSEEGKAVFDLPLPFRMVLRNHGLQRWTGHGKNHKNGHQHQLLACFWTQGYFLNIICSYSSLQVLTLFIDAGNDEGEARFVEIDDAHDSGLFWRFSSEDGAEGSGRGLLEISQRGERLL